MLLRAATRGWHVVAPVRNPDKLEKILGEEPIDRGAVTILPANPERWPDPLPIDGAIHAAGALFDRDLDTFLATNVGWTLSVLSRIPHQCPTVVLSSQSAGGPTPRGLHARNEACADEPVSAYGESKLRMERAIRREYPFRPIALLRPPMILGAGDLAALQLFRMAKNFLRTKPGLRAKTFSFLAVEDLLDAIEVALGQAASFSGQALYVASRRTVTDRQLLSAVAASMGRQGISLPLPHGLVHMVASLVDASPSLRSKFPSLTRDRVREIWPNRWVVDPAAFESKTNWCAKISLAQTLDSARAFYAEQGLL